MIAAVSNRDDIPEANVTDLTASEKHGRELFGQRCANCHTLKAANAVAAVGPNLDQLRPTKALVLDAIENGRANGNGQMAAGLYTGQDAEDVATFVAKAVGQTAQPVAARARARAAAANRVATRASPAAARASPAAHRRRADSASRTLHGYRSAVRTKLLTSAPLR